MRNRAKRQRRRWRHGKKVLAGRLLRMETLEERQLLATVRWVGSTDGFFDDPTNWLDELDVARAPAPSDDVVIDVPEDVTVTVREFERIQMIAGSNKLSIGAGGELEINADSQYDGEIAIEGTLDVDAPITITKSITWSSGIVDAGATLTVPLGTTMTIHGADTKSLVGAAGIDLGGAIHHVGTGDVEAGNSSGGIFVLDGGLYDLRSDADITGSGKIRVDGILRKSSGEGESAISADSILTPSGQIDVQTGQVTLSGSDNTNHSMGGALNVRGGATLDLTGGSTMRYAGTYIGTGGGTVRLGAGEITTRGSGVTFDMEEGLFEMTGGGISSSVARPFVNDGFMRLAGDADKLFSNRVVNNGTIVQADAGNVQGGAITNHANAVWEFQSDSGFGTTTGKFFNQGTVRKTGGAGTSSFDSNNTDFIHQGGTVEVISGRLSLATSGDNLLFSTGAHFIVAAGATLDLTGGPRTLRYTGTYTGEGEGRVVLSQGRLTAEDGGVFLDFAPGVFHWTGGRMSGNSADPIVIVDHLTISGDGEKEMTGAIVNQGTVVHEGAGDLRNVGGGSSAWNNVADSLYHFTSNGTNSTSNFNNAGVVRKSGDGEARFSTDYHNLPGGSIDVRGGELTVAGGGNQDSTAINVEAGSIFRLGGSIRHTLSGTITGTGAGRVELVGRIGGDNDFKPRLNFDENLFHWVGSAFNSTNFINDGFIHLSGDTNQTFRGNIVNHGTFVHESDTTFVMNQTSEFNNLGTFEFRGDGDFQIVDFSNTGSVLHNLGSIVKTAGLGTSRVFSDLPATSFLNNTGTIDVQTGEIELETRILQLADDTLHGGTWRAGTFSTLSILPETQIANNYGTVILDGEGAAFSPINAIAANAGHFEVLNQRDFATVGDFTNGATRLNTSMTNVFHLGRGRQVGVAIDPFTGNVFYHARNSTFIGEYDRDGVQVNAFEQPIDPRNLTDLEFTSTPINVGGIVVPAGTLLMTLGDAAPSMIFALDKTDGSILSSVTLDGAPTGLPGIAHHPGHGTLFLFSSDESVYEIDASNGRVVNSFPVAPEGVPRLRFSGIAQFAGIEVNEATGNLYIVASGQATVRELTATGHFVQDFDLSHLGLANHRAQATLSSIAIDNSTGDIWLLDESEGVFQFSPFEFGLVGKLVVGPGSTFEINGDFADLANTTTVQIGGRPTTGLFGRVTVSDSANLAGTIRVSLVDGFGPTVGDEYEIVQYSSRIGALPRIEDLDPFFDAIVSDSGITISTLSSGFDLRGESIALSDFDPQRPGQDITIEYTIENRSSADLSGDWDDSVYLSADTVLSPDDKLIGRVLHRGGVNGLARYSETLTAPLPGVIDGEYFIIVLADSKRRVADLDRGNNQTSSEAISVATPLVRPGETLTETVHGGQNLYFRVEVPEESDILISANESTNLPSELHVNRATVPSRSDFEFSANEISDTEQRVLLRQAVTGDYYILWHSSASSSEPIDVQISVRAITFDLQSISPNRVGNAGDVTITLRGAGFTPATLVELIGAEGDAVRAERIRLADPGTFAATFNLAGVATGIYDVRVSTSSAQAVLNDGLTIEDGVAGRLDARLVLPGGVRGGRRFQGEVVYGNGGNADISVPLFRLLAPPDSVVWQVGDSQENAVPVLQFVGLPDASHAKTVLAPGESGRFKFNAIVPGSGSTQFRLEKLTADSTDSIDLEAILNAIRPDGATPIWEQGFQVVAQRISRVGDYVTTLTDAAVEARELGLGLTFVGELLNYIVQREIVALPEASVRGSVFRSDGQPLGRAIVRLTNTDDFEPFSALSFHDGSFAARGLPAGEYSVSIDGFAAAAHHTIMVQENMETTGVALQIALPGTIAGNVRHRQDATPITGATVIVTNPRTGDTFDVGTDMDGVFTLGGLLAGDYRLEVESPEFVDAVVESVSVQAGDTTQVFVRLDSGAQLAGSIVDGTGMGVSDVNVSLQSTEVDVLIETVTDGSGGYRFAGLLAGNYDVVAVRADLGGGSLTELVVADEGNSLAPDLTLGPTAEITGIVRAAAMGQPLTSAVVAFDAPGIALAPVVVQPDGTFVISNLIPGEVAVQIGAADFIAQSFLLELTAGQSTKLEVDLRSLGSLRGNALFVDGDPLGGIEVVLSPLSIDSPALPKSVITDDAGQFEFRRLLDGEYAVALTIGGGRTLARQTVVLSESQDDIDLALTIDPSVVSGRVVNDLGEPISGVPVRAYSSGVLVDTAVSGEDGHYRFWVLEEGTYDLVATGFDLGILRREGIAVGAGQTITGADFEPAAGSLALTVTSSGPEMRPIENAFVSLRPAELPFTTQLQLFGETDETGSVMFANLVPGDYAVQTRREMFASSTRVITVSQDGSIASVVLGEGTILRGTVVDPLGAPVVLGTVGVVDEATGTVIFSTTDEAGSYQVNELPEGIYTVVISDGVAGSARFEVTTTVGNPQTIDVTLEHGNTVSGTVIDASSVPLIGATITVFDHLVPVASAVSDFTGRYQLTSVPAGGLKLTVTVSGFAIHEQEIEVPPQSAERLDIQVGTLAILAVESGSAPQANVMQVAPAGRGEPEAEVAEAEFPNPIRWAGNALRSLLGTSDTALLNLSGDALLGGLRPPARHDVDTRLFRGIPFDPPNHRIPEKCDELLQAVVRARRLSNTMAAAYSAYEGEFARVRDLTNADIAQMVDTAKDMAITSLAQLALISKALQAAGAASQLGLGAASRFQFGVQGLLSGIGDLAAAVTSIPRLGLTGFFAEAAGAFSVIGESYGFITATATQLGYVLVPFTAVVAQSRSLQRQIVSLENNVAQRLSDYDAAENRYLKLLQQYLAALRAIDNARDSCDEDPQDPDDWIDVDQLVARRFFSSDPNDIIGPAGVGAQHFLAQNVPLDYTILYENMPTATAPAQEVLITHQLGDAVATDTFELGDFGFGDVFVDVPEGRSFYETRLDLTSTLGFFVDFVAGVDTTGLATWRLISIDPDTGDLVSDALAGFLPPNNTPPDGDGFVMYSIEPQQDLADGTVIDAQAKIIFDLNEPINTPVFTNTIDAAAPSSRVQSLPDLVPIAFDVSWAGEDGQGAGIAFYDVFVSDNGGPFEIFRANTVDTQAVFTGEVDHIYRFFSVSTDYVGNVEPTPATHDVEATVAALSYQNLSRPQDVNGDGLITPVGDVLPLINEVNQHTLIDEFGRLPIPDGPPKFFYDVSGDGFLTPVQDILPIINYLNQLPDTENAEGEAAGNRLQHVDLAFASERVDVPKKLPGSTESTDPLSSWPLFADLAASPPTHVDRGLAILASADEDEELEEVIQALLRGRIGGG